MFQAMDHGQPDPYASRCRERLRGRRQAARLRARRHRHGRGPVGGAGDRRPTRRPRLGRDGPLLAGRARRDRAGDPAHARCRLARARRRLDAPPARRRCRAARSWRRRSPRAARSCSCATWPRRARSPTASRPSTSSSRWPIPRPAAAHPPRRRDLPRPPRLASRWATTARAQPRPAHVAHGALLLAARGLRFPEALERDRGLAAPALARSDAWPRRLPAPRAWRRTPAARRCACGRDAPEA